MAFIGSSMHLQGQDQSDQVHQHLVIGQFHAEDGQQGEESLVMALPTAFLLTCQVDVSVEALSMLHTQTFIRNFGVVLTSAFTCLVKSVFQYKRFLTFLMNKLS